jgi:hypothetical protein
VEERRQRERARERERKREGEVSPERVPKGRCSQPGSLSEENANQLARHPHANQRGAPEGMGGVPGAVLQLP